MQSELTYILGAGASFQSIPIVKSFSDRFNSFADYLNGIHSDPRFGQEKCDAFRDIYNKTKKLHEAFHSHQSFDTYFKKLFHTNQPKKIHEAKKILNLYFIWEHLSSPKNKPQGFDESKFWKQSRIDKRYDALIAGILKPLPGKSVPYCPITFITWNYDLNLFISLKNYFLPDGTFGDFMIKINKGNNIWIIENDITIINMNGYFYSDCFVSWPDLEEATREQIEVHDVLYKKISDKYFDSDYSDKDSELIRFAWESQETSSNDDINITKKASEKIFLSDHIVIIGYTFPLYNRIVDFEYFGGSNLSKKTVYIQDPNALELKSSLIPDFNIDDISKQGSKIKEITNCDSFFIPSSIYKYRDNLAELFK